MVPRLGLAQLTLRFAIEVTAFFGIGAIADAWGGHLIAIAVVVAFGTLWSLLNVKGDPSRSGAAPIPVPGAVRLVVELSALASGVAGYYLTKRFIVAAVLGALTLFHYAATWPRTRWLLQQRRGDAQ
jgi:hypothetical protein